MTTQDGSNNLITHYADQDNGGRGNGISVNDEYLAMFDSEDDVRSEFFYASAQSEDLLTAKYTNQFGNVMVLRLAEMYLIRAEANLRLGSSVGATPVADVNVIGEQSNANAMSTVDLDGIMLERELETAFEGLLIHDLKRTVQNVGNIPYNDRSLLFPIPQREMDVNSLLTQNPGYGS
ncbi:SusD family protein [Zunongwangia mangrovi]|uniref:SusD family protein n=1 Tax=Zunongwangia mangrovi TaxID=1334022 RepID=A0A1I1D4P8_9FLAO|nr:RagB/SusD family nutrient uptake outer membrane protein [Zunongwangia mangrovi]SFB68058.1 SusD family protein [Zunongwangia mangrovi]